MAAAKFAENYYTVRYATSLIDTAIIGSNAESATLASIESTLASAHTAYLAREYQTAIDDYNKAAGQIYGLIDPSFLTPGGLGFRLPTDPTLFTGLLSAAAEYLNVLPVNTPTPAPRSRVAIASNLLAPMALVDQTGIASSQLSTPPSSWSTLRLAAREELYGAGNDTSRCVLPAARSGG
jgi:hypothetical protein